MEWKHSSYCTAAAKSIVSGNIFQTELDPLCIFISLFSLKYENINFSLELVHLRTFTHQPRQIWGGYDQRLYFPWALLQP